MPQRMTRLMIKALMMMMIQKMKTIKTLLPTYWIQVTKTKTESIRYSKLSLNHFTRIFLKSTNALPPKTENWQLAWPQLKPNMKLPSIPSPPLDNELNILYKFKPHRKMHHQHLQTY